MNKIYKFICLILCLFFISCSPKLNNVLDRNDELKIISLSPSNTEILVGLNLEKNIVGLDEYSKKVEGINLDAEVFKYGDPNIEAIIQLNPDILFISGYGVNKSKFEKLEDFGIDVINIETANSIEEIYNSILLIGERTFRVKESEDIVEKLKFNLGELYKNRLNKSKKVYFEISKVPYIYSFGSDTFLNESLKLLGLENILGNFSGWIQPNEEYIINANPEIIFTNVNVKDTIEEIKGRSGWENIDAVKNNRVYYIDEDRSSRPSQYFIDAIIQMEEYLNYLNED